MYEGMKYDDVIDGVYNSIYVNTKTGIDTNRKNSLLLFFALLRVKWSGVDLSPAALKTKIKMEKKSRNYRMYIRLIAFAY